MNTPTKKIDESHIWLLIMTITPMVILTTVSKELIDNSGMRILYAGLYGGVGALIGFIANYFTKDKNRVIKIVATLIVIFISGFIGFLLVSKPSDSEILKQVWVTQKIGNIAFSNPTKLELENQEIPESVRWFYSELKMYSDKNDDRGTSFLKTKILVETLIIDDAFTSSLEAMLKSMGIKMEDVELKNFHSDEEEVSTMFSYNLNGNKVHGYGFMHLKGSSLESIWLMPVKKGFSVQYIEKFAAGIITD